MQSTTKKNLYTAIESCQDEDLLLALIEIIQLHTGQKPGAIWESLSDKQKKSVLVTESEIDYPEKQLPHDEMKSRNREWLKK